MVRVKEQTNRSTDQKRQPETDLQKYCQLNFDKKQGKFNGERRVFSINGARNRSTQAKIINLDTGFTLFTILTQNLS